MRGHAVAVIGPAEASVTELDAARRVGAALARAGATLVSGGLGGVMSASCEGAMSAGGTTVGLLPGHHRADGNQFLTVALPTGLGQLRNGLVVGAADGVIAVGGGWGTLSEIALAMRTGTPLVALNSWTVRSPDGTAGPLATATSPEAAVDLLMSML